ncbi:nucleotidyl transferase AbiEii/AbiGii toxin family protein [Candidatus Woesearchaeota archaeon]|nr:nucleotidyl transferase AbiEii/AbiGii toxin family protein [Candidatus Woesearchaeota archaeon]
MISLDGLKSIAKLKGIKNIGFAEKDYLLEISLLSVSRNTKDELIFKGDTCLYKFYKLDRFSEDLDFTLRKPLDIDVLIKKIIADLASFGIEAEVKEKKKVQNSIMLTIRAKGLLYDGRPQSLSSFGIDMNTASSIDTEPILANYSPLYPDIPSFTILIMPEQEILAEKARAIMTRNKARDVYDFWFLLKKGIGFDTALVRKKFRYYRQEWDEKLFIKKVEEKKKIWEKEILPLVPSVPDFNEVKSLILEKLP